MAARPAAAASTSVRVRFPPGALPENLARATAIFAPFGDIARLDLSVGVTSGCVLVTFFDVRSAEKVVLQLPGVAEFQPPAAHDFCAVIIPTSVFAQLPASFRQFHAFGEIAGLSINGEDVVVEFYDMRAAQQVAFAIPGSRPRRPADIGNGPSAAAMLAGLAAHSNGHGDQALAMAETQPQWAAPQEIGSTLLPPNLDALSSKEQIRAITQAALQAAQAASAVVAATADMREHPAEAADADASGFAPAPCLIPQPTMTASPTAVAGKGGGGTGTGKPVREKLSTEDFTKFDVVPAAIKSGEDLRTTVMVRNIPKACAREGFVELLANCGLSERYSFFYMPFDKRRNIHCGFAFIDFKSPNDVLQLHDSMQQSSMWCNIGQRGNSSGGGPPALSFARLQGQEQLMKHFSLSAVMYDHDARKRPLFVGGEGTPKDEQAYEQKTQCDVNAQVSGEQPCYVSLPSPMASPHAKELGLFSSKAGTRKQKQACEWDSMLSSGIGA